MSMDSVIRMQRWERPFYQRPLQPSETAIGEELVPRGTGAAARRRDAGNVVAQEAKGLQDRMHVALMPHRSFEG